VGLPPAGGWNLRPNWLGYQSVRIGFPVIGLLFICAGALIGFATLKQRKVIGMQDVKEGLITSGCYRYFRHPIGTGIIWVSLGLPLVMRNPDGLLMFPAIFVIHFAAEIIEERNDMCVRFREQYQAYRQTTRMFGPIWLWSILFVLLLVIISIGNTVAMNWWNHIPEHISPNIVEIGSFQIRYYGLMYLIAFAVTYLLVLHRLKNEGYEYSKNTIKTYFLYAILGVLIGGRLGFVLFYDLM